MKNLENIRNQNISRIYFVLFIFEEMKITIIGCGWLGYPLAQKLKEVGHLVYGSSTHLEKLAVLMDAEIIPFIFNGSEHQSIPDEARTSHLLILNFPPGKTSNYPEQVKNILDQVNPSTKVIFTSSTGVYEEVEGEVTEESPIKADHPVALAERVIQESGKNFCILRLAGLIGGERHPVKYLSGRSVQDGNMAVNLIQRDDVISGILKVIEKDEWNTVYNLVNPKHPSKADYYSEMARKMGLVEPIFEPSVKMGKSVSGKKISDELGFNYNHLI